jgi:DNA-damage-inducible protein J
MMVRIAKDRALPVQPPVPNAETIAAMKAARRGELVTVGSTDQLLASLNADRHARKKRHVRRVGKAKRAHAQ